jgi:hypothetical protein
VRPGRQAADDGSFARSVGVHTARGALLIALAVIVGFVLLNKIDTGKSAPSASVKTTTPTATPVTAPPESTTTTRPPSAVKVLVVNGTSTKGEAGAAANLIKPHGYNVLAPADGTAAAKAARRNTVVYYTAGYDIDARTIAGLIGLTPTPPTAVMPTSGLPVSSTLGANVLVLIGPDYVSSHGRTGETTSTTRRL